MPERSSVATRCSGPTDALGAWKTRTRPVDLMRVRLPLRDQGECGRRERNLPAAGVRLRCADHAVVDRLANRQQAFQDLVHHSDRGTQYLSIRYTERLADAGIELSVGSRGDAYDNALAETVIGLFKTEVIRRQGPWRSLEAVEFATLAWVDWFNHRRLLEPIGDMPPAEYEARYYDQAAVA